MPYLVNFLLLAALQVSASASDWNLEKRSGNWGLSVGRNHRILLDGLPDSSVAKLDDTLPLSLIADTLTIVPLSPDSVDWEEQSSQTRTIHGPFRFGPWSKVRLGPSPMDVQSATGIEYPFRQVEGGDGSGWVWLGDLHFAPCPPLQSRIDGPLLLRDRFVDLVWDSSRTSAVVAQRWGIFDQTQLSQRSRCPPENPLAFCRMDSTLERDRSAPYWFILQGPGPNSRMVWGRENLVMVQDSAGASGYHFTDGYRRFAQKVSTSSFGDWVIQWSALYGDGTWEELCRLGRGKLALLQLGGYSGGEGHDLAKSAERENAPMPWRVDPKTGKVFVRPLHRRERQVLPP